MKPIFFLLFLVSLTAFAGPVLELKTQDQFDSYLIENKFNGVLLVAQKDKILLKKAFGVKDFTTNTPLSADDKFQIGSVSKQFTAAALLKLQQEHKLSIDDEVIKYLPEFEVLKGIKIRDVLNHTSGVADFTEPKNGFWQLVDYNKVLSLNDILNFIIKLPFDFSPKTNWNYSNSGYIIAGKIVEKLSGQSWSEYIKTQFLEPLQMNNTGYVDYFSQVSDVVGHANSEEKLTPIKDFNMSWALSAGGLYSTVDDLLKWISIYDSSMLLSEDSKAQMQTPFLNNYALGVQVEKFNNEIKISHGGRTPGFTTNLTYLKSAKFKVVKFDNTDGNMIDGSVVDVTALALNFYINGTTTAVKLKRYPINKNIFSDYVGNYINGEMNLKVFIKDDALFLQPNDGQPAYPLVANDQDSFRLLGIAGEEFIRDPNAKVIELKHYQNGDVSVFKKELN